MQSSDIINKSLVSSSELLIREALLGRIITKDINHIEEIHVSDFNKAIKDYGNVNFLLSCLKSYLFF